MGSNLHDSPEEKGQLAVTESSLAADNGIKSTDDIDDRACVRQSVCPFLIHHISVSDVSEPLFLTRSVHSHCTS